MRCARTLEIACLLAIAVVGRAHGAESEVVAPFLARHCIACHGPDKQEADLRLDTLGVEITSAESAATWSTVLERLAAGEMPPDDRPRPPAEQQRRIVSWLKRSLHEAGQRGLIAAAKRGPRRLNRLEYQNSVCDLLGIRLELAGMLPEDGSAAGFDKVGSALNISPVQIEKYLEASDAALDEALVERPPVSTTTVRYTMKDCRTCYGQFVKHGIYAEKNGDPLLWYRTDKWAPIEPFAAPARGNYRVRISAYGTLIGDDAERPDDAVLMAVHTGKFRTGGRGAHLVDVYAVEWDQPRVYEFVDFLEVGQTFKVMIASQTSTLNRVAQYTGPALAWQWIEITGPLEDDSAQRRRALLFDGVDREHGTQADADRLLDRFATRAFRRPASKREVAPYRAVMHEEFEQGATFVEALRVGMQAVLCAPEFLFVDRTDPGDAYDLAARLSYFLWSAAPDDELLSLAGNGQLNDPSVRRGQVERMLADARSATFTRHFLDHWLDLKKIDFTTPDRGLYPTFDEPLRDAMLKETRTFFDELLTHDLSVTNFIDSDFAMLNERLARHYGIAGVR
ncbi:MAG TPA: DUF1592 domain-containing protein, partial [Pirellulales bacterium]|nr:DUF1592 domain-containing protein [Pirellulales bacterium]